MVEILAKQTKSEQKVIICGKCGCKYSVGELYIDTGVKTENGETILKTVDVDSSCPQCGFGKKENVNESGSKKQLILG